MKIGIIAHLKHPIKAPFAGGLEAFTYQVAQKLTDRGHEVILFASSSSEASGKLYSILDDSSYEQQSGIRHKKPDMSSEYIAEHHAYYQLMTDIDMLGLDIIFNNCLHYVPVTMANLITTPLVTVLHTPPFYELKNAITAAEKKVALNYITVSKCNADNWGEYIENCPVILNGIEVEKWDYYETGRQKNYAVWFGRIHPDKGLDLAIKAAKLAGLPLKVAGGIADQRYYKDKIQPLLDDNTEMLGLLNHEEINKLIGEAQVCLITPVWQEPFGLVVAEALACGTPVAGVNAGALPEVLGEECGFLVNPGDLYGLSEAMHKAAKLDRKKIRQYAESNLSIETMLKQYEELFEILVENKTTIAS